MLAPNHDTHPVGSLDSPRAVRLHLHYGHDDETTGLTFAQLVHRHRRAHEESGGPLSPSDPRGAVIRREASPLTLPSPSASLTLIEGAAADIRTRLAGEVARCDGCHERRPEMVGFSVQGADGSVDDHGFCTVACFALWFRRTYMESDR